MQLDSVTITHISTQTDVLSSVVYPLEIDYSTCTQSQLASKCKHSVFSNFFAICHKQSNEIWL